MNPEAKIRRSCPLDSTNWFSRALFAVGLGKSINHEDLTKFSKTDDPSHGAKLLKFYWNEEEKKGSKNASIIKAIIKTFGFKYVGIALLMIFTECVTRVSQPLLVGRLIRFFNFDQNATEEEKSSAYNSACVMAALYCFSSICISFGRNHYFFLMMRHCMNVRSAITILIYGKILCLSKSSFDDTSVGHILNVVANDLNRFDEAGMYLVYLVAAPLQSIIVIVILWQYIGPACMGGMVILFLFIPFQAVMGRLFNRFRSRTTLITDKRVKFMSEIIGAMKVIKFYCWEKPFGNIVAEIRRNEIGTLKLTCYLKGVNSAVYFIACRSMLFATFICYLFTHSTGLDAETVFVSMSMFNALRIPVTKNFPEAIGQGAETLVACARVKEILVMEEKTNKPSQSVFFPQPGGVTFVNFSGKWNKTLQKLSMKNVSFKINPGTLCTIVGSVGSGKTCLLYSILNEIDQVAGNMIVNGLLSYHPQESWCFSGSVRDNILLGSSFDKDRYEEVIKVCSLVRDLHIFPHGDQTYIGEKGYTLSGGQKARITLARAVYRKADIYLLDDPLSAVDPSVATHIFDHCIKEFLAGKTIILVTHQLQFLSKSNTILVLEDGAIVASGSYDKLSKSGIDFLDILNREDFEDGDTDSESEDRDANLVDTNLPHANQNVGTRKQSLKKRRSSSKKSTKSGSLADSGAKNSDREEEKKTEGGVTSRVYWDYIKSGASIPFALFCLGAAVVPQVIYQYTDLWLSKWTDSYTFTRAQNQSTLVSNLNQAPNNATTSATYHSIIYKERDNVLIYTGLMIATFIAALLRVISLFLLCLRASINLHDTILSKVLRCPLRFFETNPLGRIMNRFTRDLGQIDQRVPGTFVQVINNISDVLGIVITSSIIEPYLMIPAALLIAIAVPFRYIYLRTARDVKRLDSITRSPVYGHISTTFDGLTTLRAFNLESFFKDIYLKNIEDATSTRFWVIATSRCVGFCLDVFALIYLCSVCIYLVVSGTNITPGNAGLVLSSGLLLIGVFQGTVRLTAELETQMICVERVLEYKDLPQEKVRALQSSVSIDATPSGGWRKRTATANDTCVEIFTPKGWPNKGTVSFGSVSLSYTPKGAKVLENVSFSVPDGAKVGIVGRTGAGKSSLVSVLFRLVDFEGTVLIDGIDSKSVDLTTLRDNVSIIPQDPVLFSGTIRRNLDPFNTYGDADLWNALEDSNLSAHVKSMDGELSAHVSATGSNLSVGQRQLVCLARALLKNNKILVLDEATANVDLETDEIIQKTIRKNFATCTVLTIAHRLNTIIDADKVLVMDAGHVAEYDHPYILLKRDGADNKFFNKDGAENEVLKEDNTTENGRSIDGPGMFASMVEQTGQAMSNLLRMSAEQSYHNMFPGLFLKKKRVDELCDD